MTTPLPPLPPRRLPYSPPPPPASAPPLPSRYSPSREGRSPSSVSPNSHWPLPPGAFCTATSDLESLVVVPLGSVSSAAAIKDLVLSRLHISDEDAPRHAFHLTRIGAGEGRPTSDGELWDAVRASAAAEGPQVTVFVKEVVPRRDNASPETGRSAAEYAGGAARREREQREREMGNGRRESSPTARHRSPTLVGELDEFGTHRDGGLRSDNARWPSGISGGHHGSRQASASSTDSSRVVASPQSLGQQSPPVMGASPIAGGGSGFRAASGSSGGIETSPEDYFHVPVVPNPPPSQQRSSAHSPNAAAGAYQPARVPQQYPPQAPQVVMGPSGPTRRLPPQPQPQPPQQDGQRSQTVPPAVVAASSPGWSWTVQAPHKQTTVPIARPPVPPHAPAPSSSLRGADPRTTLPQYGSQPYRNLPLPAGQSPYHNLSLQNQFHSVEYVNNAAAGGPPRATTLGVQPAGRMASKSVDNLRSGGPQGGYHGAPPQASPALHASSGFRSPSGPVGHPGAAGSRPPQPPQPPSFPQDTASPPPIPVCAPASAFYSAPVQAQHAAAAAAAARGPPVPRRPTLEQTHSQPAPGPSGARPATMHDLAVADAQGWAQDGPRRRAETVDYGGGGGATTPQPQPSAPAFEDDDGAYDGLVAAAEGRRLPPGAGAQQQQYSQQRSASASTSPPSSATGPSTPASDALPLPAVPAVPPKLVDEFGDPLDEETSTWFPVGQQQVALAIQQQSRAPASPPKPQEEQQQPTAPRLLDEFGDPLDEETSTWFPVNQASGTSVLPSQAQAPSQPPAASKPRLVDEFGDALDEESNTWFPVNQPALPSFVPQSAAPNPPPASAPPASAPPNVVAVPTTAVPAPSSYGSSSSPMRRQTSASSTGGGSSGPSPVSGGSGTGGGAAPSSAGGASDKRDSVPDAQDWTQTILSRFGAGTGAPAGGEEGTLLAGGGGTGTLRAVAPSAPPSAASTTPKLVDEFGDDLEDSSTFFPGHGPNVPSPLGRASSLGSRPSLRLKIDTPTPPQSMTPVPGMPPTGGHGRRSASASGETDASFAGALERLNLAGRSGAATPTEGVPGARKPRIAHPRLDDLVRLPTSPFARRNSFAAREHDQDWAFRPPVETVLEHLDVFFPEHDLDKPVFDLPTPGPSTPSTNSSSPVRDVPPPSSASAVTPSTLASRRAAHLGYRKSIRVVAQDRKRMLQKAGNNVARAASGLASNLLRRKSTKLFGARIEEVTSAQMKQIGAIKQTSDEDPENCASHPFPLSAPPARCLCLSGADSGGSTVVRVLAQSRTSGSRATSSGGARTGTSTSRSASRRARRSPSSRSRCRARSRTRRTSAPRA